MGDTDPDTTTRPSPRLRGAIALVAAIAVAAAVGIVAMRSRDAEPEATTRTWAVTQRVLVTGRSNLDIVALDAVEGAVPNTIRKMLFLPADNTPSSSKDSDVRFSPRTTRISDVTIEVSPEPARNAVAIVGRGTDASIVRGVVKTLAAELVGYENAKEHKKFVVRLEEIQDAISGSEAELEAIRAEVCTNPDCESGLAARRTGKEAELAELRSLYRRIASEDVRRTPNFALEFDDPQAVPE